MRTLICLIFFFLTLNVFAFPRGGAIKMGNIQDDPSRMHSGEVVETKSVGEYSYLLIKGKTDSLWVAVPKTKAKKGDRAWFIKGFAKKDFKSRELNRTFKELYFTNYLTVNGVPAQISQKAKGPIVRSNVKGVKKADFTVNEVYRDYKKLKGKKIKIRGEVVKFSKEIMGMNWIHLQDGSGKNGTHDLVVTTKGDVKVGDRVLVDAKVITNKNFGFGYYYDVLLQDAKITIEN